jgi:hypothetical protein
MSAFQGESGLTAKSWRGLRFIYPRDEARPFAFHALSDAQFLRKQRTVALLVTAVLGADDAADPWATGYTSRSSGVTWFRPR